MSRAVSPKDYNSHDNATFIYIKNGREFSSILFRFFIVCYD